MPDPGRKKAEISDTVEELMESSSLSPLTPSTHYSGDGTWTEAHVICALVEATNEAEALAKASASFGHREGRPEPLFSHNKADTFELAVEIKSLPLAIAETEWDKREPISELGTSEAESAINQAIADSHFEDGDSIIYNQWGEKLVAASVVYDYLESIETGYIVVGLGLEPTGSGNDQGKYIGETFDIYCQQCEQLGADCVNIVFEDRMDDHIGVWDCNQCANTFRGPHPQEAEA